MKLTVESLKERKEADVRKEKMKRDEVLRILDLNAKGGNSGAPAHKGMNAMVKLEEPDIPQENSAAGNHQYNAGNMNAMDTPS
ncbi:hypothetical protein PENTCL1PPCAC_3360, partial [Pristionchus entomophagus]